MAEPVAEVVVFTSPSWEPPRVSRCPEASAILRSLPALDAKISALKARRHQLAEELHLTSQQRATLISDYRRIAAAFQHQSAPAKPRSPAES